MAEAPIASPAEDGPPHLLLVDDDPRLLGLLRRYLSEKGFLVTTAASAGEARAKLEGLQFDLIVLDVMMPGENGFELCGTLRRAKASVPILLLTALDEPENRILGLESGADDYLPKPFEPRELVLRIQAILRRAQVAAPTPDSDRIHFGPFVFDRQRGELRRGTNPIRLSAAEASLIATLARRPGVPVSREELAAASPDVESQRSIDVQMTRLRRKLEADPKSPRFLQTVRGTGYVLVPD